jgi:hypothetical protein
MVVGVANLPGHREITLLLKCVGELLALPITPARRNEQVESK